MQGLLLAYPHTSNWDFVLLIMAKWAVGVRAYFWGKESLFRIPLFGWWLRAVGGVPVQRTAPQGTVAQAVEQFEKARAQGRRYWVALAPEGTRKYTPGWRSGFYQVAYQSKVPLGLARVDYATRVVRFLDFMVLSGDEKADMQRIAQVYAGVQGCVPANASPICLLDPTVPRETTVVK